jgi:hypothetical protein
MSSAVPSAVRVPVTSTPVPSVSPLAVSMIISSSSSRFEKVTVDVFPSPSIAQLWMYQV